MEDWQSEINKKSKMPIVVIIILVLVILGLVFYIGYDKEILFEKKKPVQTEQKIQKEPLEELYIESDFVQKYYQIYKEDSCLKRKYYKELNTSAQSKLYLTYLQLANDLVKIRECEEESLFLLENEDYFCGLSKEKQKTYFLEEEPFFLRYRELFGQKEGYQLDDFLTDEGIYHYEKEKQGYTFYGKAEENSCTLGTSTLERATLKGKTLTLYIKMEEEDQQSEVHYVLEKEDETNNYIFKSRSEKIISSEN